MKTLTHRILGGLAAVAMAGALTACGGPDAPESPDNPFNGTYEGNVFLTGEVLPPEQPTPYMELDGTTMRSWVGPDKGHFTEDEYSYIEVETFKSGEPKKVVFYNEYDEAEWTFVSTRNGDGAIKDPTWRFGHYVPVDFDPDAIRAEQEKEAKLAAKRDAYADRFLAYTKAESKASDHCMETHIYGQENADKVQYRACLSKSDMCRDKHRDDLDIEAFESCFYD